MMSVFRFLIRVIRVIRKIPTGQGFKWYGYFRPPALVQRIWGINGLLNPILNKATNSIFLSFRPDDRRDEMTKVQIVPVLSINSRNPFSNRHCHNPFIPLIRCTKWTCVVR